MASKVFHSSGSVDIDRVRHEIASSPSSADNCRRRSLLLYMWLSALQQQGTDTRPFTDVDKRYYLLEDQIVAGADERLLSEMAALIDEDFGVMVDMQSRLIEQGPIATPGEGDVADCPPGGDMEAEWPMFQGDIHHTGYSEAPGPRYGRSAWKLLVGLGWYARPVVEEGKVYVASPGTRCWSKVISTHPIYADLVSAEDRLLISDSNLMLYCLSADGRTRWEKSTLNAFVDPTGQRIFTDELSGGTYYQSKPTAHRGKIFFGTPSGFLYAADAQTGEPIWKFEMGAAISAGLARADGRILAGQQGGERFFYCVDAEDGALIWKQTLPGGWVWGSAMVYDGLVYVPTVNGYAVCLDAKTGHIVWMFPTAQSIPAEPAIDGDLVYFGSWSRSIYAFNKKTGGIVWKTNGIALDSGTLIAFDGKVYLPHHSNIFKYLDGKTGDVLNEGNTNDEEKGAFSDFNATPAFHGGRAFFLVTRRHGAARRAAVFHGLLRRSRDRQNLMDAPGRRRPVGTGGCIWSRLYCLGHLAVFLLSRRRDR